MAPSCNTRAQRVFRPCARTLPERTHVATEQHFHQILNARHRERARNRPTRWDRRGDEWARLRDTHQRPQIRGDDRDRKLHENRIRNLEWKQLGGERWPENEVDELAPVRPDA